MSRHRNAVVGLALSVSLGCYAGTEGSGPTAPPDEPELPSVPAEISAIIEGEIVPDPSLSVYSMYAGVSVLTADCVTQVPNTTGDGPAETNSKDARRFRTVLRVARTPVFEACVQVTVYYSLSPAALSGQSVSRNYPVRLRVDGASPAAAPFQVRIPIP